jgi:anti-sigma-28 factor FlgM
LPFRVSRGAVAHNCHKNGTKVPIVCAGDATLYAGLTMKASYKHQQTDLPPPCSQILRRRRPKADQCAEDSTARAQKLEKLRKAVADGSYHVSISDLAGKLLDHMRRR